MTGAFLLPDSLLLILAVVIALIIAAAVTYYLFRRPKTIREPGRTITSQDHRPARPGYQPAAKATAPAGEAKSPVPPGRGDTPYRPKDLSVVDGRADLTASLCALVEKYSFGELTLATADGLVFASSGGESAQTDAAHYSETFIRDPLSETPGVTLFGVSHKGSELIGIIRTTPEVSEEIVEMVENDTKDILNRWI